MMNQKRSLLLIFFQIALTSIPIIGGDHPKEEIRIVFIGDSLTEGYGVAKESAFPSLIEKKLKQKYPGSTVVNAGISGATSQIAYAQVKWHIQKKRPDLIVLSLGANDGLRGHPVSILEKNLEKAIQFTQESKTPVILIGMRLPINYSEPYRTEFEKVFSRLAKRYHLPFIPFLIKDVALEKDLNLEDRIHPNEKGHKKIADNLWPALDERVSAILKNRIKQSNSEKKNSKEITPVKEPAL